MRVSVLGLLAASFAAVGTANPITFIPPNDTTGTVFTTDSNDGWSGGRGIVFLMTADETISSVGLFHNLTDILLSYALYQTTDVSGDVASGQTLLASGSSTVTTSGLEWIDFSFAPLTLFSGSTYHLEFLFDGNGNENFFYDNSNAIWSQGAYSALDGTSGGDTGNSVVGAFRIDGLSDGPSDGGSSVPEPSSMGLMLGGLSLVVWRKFKR